MFPRSQEAAIARATETQTQVISAFGAASPLASQAKALVEAITAAAKMAQEPKTLIEVFEPGPK